MLANVQTIHVIFRLSSKIEEIQDSRPKVASFALYDVITSNKHLLNSTNYHMPY